MALWKFTKAILESRPIDLYNRGNMCRDFTYIDDIVAGIIASLDNPPADDGKPKAGGFVSPHRLYNIGNNQPEPLMDIVGEIEKACGREAERNLLPMQDGDVHETIPISTRSRRSWTIHPKPTFALASAISCSGIAGFMASSS